jgi:nitroimidazol reductase NimA-like FMN-containing flavoprotein (pyridoxamine 5'-phosphate oxidase superfamily)
MSRQGSLALLAVLLLAGNPAIAAETADTPRQIAQDGRVVPGPAITPNQVRGPDHPHFPPGWTCSECHAVAFGTNVISTASRQYWNNYTHLDNDQIWARVLKALPGRERFSMATVYRDRPTNTTIDFVLDQDEKVFYAVSEKGTEKLSHLKRNPNISAVRADGWTVAEGGAKQWFSIQIDGTSEVITSKDERFMAILKKYALARISEERAIRRFDIQRITPRHIVFFDTTLLTEGISPYQYWSRDGRQ